MRAAQIYHYGSPEVFTIENIPEPAIGPRDVLVEVHAASVNPVDHKIRSGGQRGVIHYKLPVVLGMDVSGMVVAKGAAVTRFRIGDLVYGSPTHKRQGTYAEFVAIDESELALKPTNLTHQEAASIPLVGLTAWECLVVKADLTPGQRVLIQAGSGGVGTFAIQLAKVLGAGEIITTCSTRNVELVQSLGADRVIDYTVEKYDEVLSEIDIVLDALGFEHWKRGRSVVRRGGHLVSIVGGFPRWTHKYGPVLGVAVALSKIVAFTIGSRLKGVHASHALRRADGKLLTQIAQLIEGGLIRARIDRVYALDEIAQAHAHSESGRARGKIVIALK